MAVEYPEGFHPIDDPVEYPDGFQKVHQQPPMPTGKAGDQELSQGTAGKLLDAFGEGYANGWGTDKLGSWINPLIGPPVKDMKGKELDHPISMLKSINETYVRPLAWGADWAKRAVTAWYPGMQEAGVEAGRMAGQEKLAKDIVSMPDAFMGSVGALARPRTPLEQAVSKGPVKRITGGVGDQLDLNVANDAKVIGPAKPDISVGTPAEAAKAVIEEPRTLGPVSFEAKIATDGKLVTEGEGAPVRIHADPDNFMNFKQFEKLAEENNWDMAAVGDAAKEKGFHGVKLSDGSMKVFDPRVIEEAGREVDVKPHSLSAAQTPAEILKGEKLPVYRSITDKAGNIRLDTLAASDDAKNVIKIAARERDGYQAARAGEMPLEHRQQMANILGIDPMDARMETIGRQFNNTHEFRLTMETFIQSAEEIGDAVKRANVSGSTADLIELQRMVIRHDILQERIAGFKAEWGKTGQAMQEFTDQVKDAQSLGRFLKEKKGTNLEDFRERVKQMSTMDPRTQLPKYLTAQKNVGFMDKLAYYWTNSILSGTGSQAAYLVADTLFAAGDALLTTPIAAGVGGVRKMFSRVEVDRVYAGEALAKSFGYVRGFPDAVSAAFEAMKNDMRTPMPGALQSQFNPITGQKGGVNRPIGGTAGAVIGVPARTLGAIQTFFEHFNYSAKMHAEAYRGAVKDGVSPRDPMFWQVAKNHFDFPKPEAIEASIAHAEYMTYIAPLGPTGKRLQGAIGATPVGRFIIPFTHVPPNVAKITIEHSPFAALGPDIRDTLLGKKGEVARDTAIAKIILGSSFSAWMVSLASNDSLTGDGPSDPAQYAQWALTHKPTSIKMGDQWYDYRRLGVPAMLMRMSANLHDIGYDVKHEEYSEAAIRLSLAAGNFMSDSGLSTLAGLTQAMNDKTGRKTEQFWTSFGSSFMPFSSLGYQMGNMIDPTMRDTSDFISALRSKVPFASKYNEEKLNWLGETQPNPRFGAGAILPNSPVGSDPLSLEMQRLDLNPAHMEKSIHGVRLEPEVYHELQQQFGLVARPLIETTMKMPGWKTIPDAQRREVLNGLIKTARQQATTIIQFKHQNLIQEAVDLKTGAVLGLNPKREMYRRPE